jgi:hypothetical protein
MNAYSYSDHCSCSTSHLFCLSPSWPSNIRWHPFISVFPDIIKLVLTKSIQDFKIWSCMAKAKKPAMNTALHTRKLGTCSTQPCPWAVLLPLTLINSVSIHSHQPSTVIITGRRALNNLFPTLHKEQLTWLLPVTP